jgi:hypothetical protein
MTVAAGVRRAVRSAVPALVAGLALAPAAQAADRACPAKRGTLAHADGGRVWHTATGLYGCSIIYGKRPQAFRLGPWRPGTRVWFDGVAVAWTVPLVRDGVRSDRLWAGLAESGTTWLRGRQLVPAAADAPAREGRIQRLIGPGFGMGWITQAGDVVLALQLPQSDPGPVGTLPGTLKADHSLVLVGSWPQTPAADLAAGAKLVVGSGEGDDCGGGNPYTLTVQPDPAGPRVGATWYGDYAHLC